ncbi:hypothetical protein BT69DRAFT_1335896 [Atractiella rhizophila]|nr:hypothetical protein BT69DRAFT_1335896 [Atractiella rhizophila]
MQSPAAVSPTSPAFPHPHPHPHEHAYSESATPKQSLDQQPFSDAPFAQAPADGTVGSNLISGALREGEKEVVLPTVTITFEGRTVKARIDKGVPLVEIIRQLCTSPTLAVKDPPSMFCLRDALTNELITPSTLPRKLEARTNFRLTSSPSIDAADFSSRLRLGLSSGKSGEAEVKKSLFQLKNLLREMEFSKHFLERDGLKELVKVVRVASGNTLAYALTCAQNLLELEIGQGRKGKGVASEDSEWDGELNWDGWEKDGVDEDFVKRIVQILVDQTLVNICRPATAIIRFFVTEYGKSLEEDSYTIPSRFSPPIVEIYPMLRAQKGFFKTLVTRLNHQGGGDNMLINSSLGLLTSLIRFAVGRGELGLGKEDDEGENGDGRGEGLMDELERLEVGKAVVRLMESHASDDVTPSILQFQAAIILHYHNLMRTAVSPDDPVQSSILEMVYAKAKLAELTDLDIEESKKWKAIGFQMNNPWWEFDRVGVLGLKTMKMFAVGHQEDYVKLVLEQVNRAEDRRCPFAKACIEVIEILAELFDFNTGVSQMPTSFLPFTLSFWRVHALALKFFFRMWAESGSTDKDFARVSNLVRSQVYSTFGAQVQKTWYEVESEFQESEYRVVRDRQIRELEIEDELLSKAPVRNLRGRLYRESFEFIRAQRINCLHEGAWFLTTSPTTQLHPNMRDKDGRKGSLAPVRVFRFYRLAANKKFLHFVESTERVPIRGGLDDLPEKIDIAQILDVVPNSIPPADSQRTPRARGFSLNAAPNQTNLLGSQPNNRLSTFSVSSESVASSGGNLSFNLLSSEGVIATMHALDSFTYSEWIDGLSLLKKDGNGHIITKESADLVHILTEIGVKMKLLDLSGEKVEIPAQLPVPSVPLSCDFYYADTP